LHCVRAIPEVADYPRDEECNSVRHLGPEFRTQNRSWAAWAAWSRLSHPEENAMQERKFEELEDRATDHSLPADSLKQLESRARVVHEIEAMIAEKKAFKLSDEEMDMLTSFRRFKLRMRKNGEVFKWQSRIPDGVQIAEETGQIVHPQEIT
jgi:hypothetical protein